MGGWRLRVRLAIHDVSMADNNVLFTVINDKMVIGRPCVIYIYAKMY